MEPVKKIPLPKNGLDQDAHIFAWNCAANVPMFAVYLNVTGEVSIWDMSRRQTSYPSLVMG